MSIVSKTDVLNNIVTLAALGSSFFSNDAELAQEIKRSLDDSHIQQNKVEEILRIVEQADRASLPTFTSILR